MVDYLKKALIYGHTRRISSWIYYQFTTFEGKSLATSGFVGAV